MEAFFFLDLYKNDVISDLADAFPGDDIFAFSTEKIAESAWTGNYQSSETAGDAVELYVNGAAQTPAGAGVDDLFLFQFT